MCFHLWCDIGLNLTSFRYAVQVIIAQNWGEVVTEAKCSWDLQYDSYSSYIFINVSVNSIDFMYRMVQ